MPRQESRKFQRDAVRETGAWIRSGDYLLNHCLESLSMRISNLLVLSIVVIGLAGCDTGGVDE